MSLYIRVLNGFYTHRKTIRLRVSLGDAAFWVPPRLWAYASDNQPDGCFEQYTAEELAMLIGYSGGAKAMLEALLGAGFLDSGPLRIHDWEEHNGYHASYAARAKKAASARWRKSPTPPPDLTVPERIVPEGSIASRMLEASKKHSPSVPVEGENTISQISELLKSVGEFYDRLPDRRPSHLEESSAAQIVKRLAWRVEVETVRAWHNGLKDDERKFFPQKLSTLLEDWEGALDRASRAKKPIKTGFKFGLRGNI